MNLPECRLPKTHKEIVRIMVFSTPYLKDGQATSNTKARAPLPGFSRVIWDEWGKKGVRMDTKALKKQMGAAIAMVLVAAVALGSATFAWFVTNNTVKAQTSSITAQSNASYMTIKYNATAVGVDDTFDVASDTEATKLYPATFGEQKGSTPGKFMTGYGTSVSDGTLSDKLSLVGDAGTPEEAVNKAFAKKNVFNISSRGQNLSNFKIASVEAKSADGKNTDLSTTSDINSALRLLVMCGERWVVLDQTGTFKLGSDGITTADGVLADTITADKDTEVDIYIFFEGSDAKVYTNNLKQLKDSSKLTVTFTADNQNKK